MGYMKIPNLYACDDILLFKWCYALEKIHGTSAHIAWRDNKLSFFSGGEPHERFVSIFDQDFLTEHFTSKFPDTNVVVYGEAYGGKQQGMSATYGKDLKFIAFDVMINDVFLNVVNAYDVVYYMNLEFVHYTETLCEIDELVDERNKPSVQAIRNGIAEPKMREGIVLRPPVEMQTSNGKRVIAKFKNEEFAEHSKPRKVKDTTVDYSEANAVADDWVNPMRLTHVIDQLVSSRDNKEYSIEDTGKILQLMVDDIKAESVGEVDVTKDVERAIKTKTAKLFKSHLESSLERT